MSNESNFTNMTIDKDFNKEMDEYPENPDATMEFPNKRLLNALEESEDIISGKIKAKRYKNFDEMVDDLD